MNKTNIEYLTHTWNPIAMRCTPVSEACEHCWHLTRAKMLAKNPKIIGLKKDAYSGFSEPYLSMNELQSPLRRNKPSIIGVQFMGDLFHPNIPDESIKDIFNVIYKCRHHKYVILTKRPSRMVELLNTILRDAYSLANWTKDTLPDNLWFGVTAENQERADERIPVLLQIPAAVRFVSVEPMLSAVDLIRKYPFNNFLGPQNEGQWLNCVECGHKTNQYGINWVICGAETGPGARYMKTEWAVDLHSQCEEANVPLFFKKASKSDLLVDILRIAELPREYPIKKEA